MRDQSAPWHEDGLTPDQRKFERWMRQAHRDSASMYDFLEAGGWGIEHVSPHPRDNLDGAFLMAAVERHLGDIRELRTAIRAGRHRTAGQNLAIDALAVFVTVLNPDRKMLAYLLQCHVCTFSRLDKRGAKVLSEIRASQDEISERMDDAHAKLDLILRALGLDVVLAAELMLSHEFADELVEAA